MNFHITAQAHQIDIEYLKKCLQHSYKERFLIATMLSKVQIAMNNPTIFYHPFNSFQKSHSELFIKSYAKNI